MVKSNLKKALLFTSSTLIFSGQVVASDGNHSNIVFIVADDLGWNDLSCMGSNYYEMPNLDWLVNRGVRFTNSYSACQVSSPSRASIMIGKYTPRHAITDWIGAATGESWCIGVVANFLVTAP